MTNTPNGPVTLMTRAQLCDYLQVSQGTLDNLLRDGMPVIRLRARTVRFDPVAVLAWYAESDAADDEVA